MNIVCTNRPLTPEFLEWLGNIDTAKIPAEPDAETVEKCRAMMLLTGLSHTARPPEHTVVLRELHDAYFYQTPRPASYAFN